jgi:two-component system response regulator
MVHLDVDLQVAKDGETAICFFESVDADTSSPCPSLVILDINLPKKQGGDVLRQMRKTTRCANAPVLVLTSSDSERDRNEMKELGVKAYFRKPSDYESFLQLGEVARKLIVENPQR